MPRSRKGSVSQSSDQESLSKFQANWRQRLNLDKKKNVVSSSDDSETSESENEAPMDVAKVLKEGAAKKMEAFNRRQMEIQNKRKMPPPPSKILVMRKRATPRRDEEEDSESSDTEPDIPSADLEDISVSDIDEENIAEARERPAPQPTKPTRRPSLRAVLPRANFAVPKELYLPLLPSKKKKVSSGGNPSRSSKADQEEELFQDNGGSLSLIQNNMSSTPLPKGRPMPLSVVGVSPVAPGPQKSGQLILTVKRNEEPKARTRQSNDKRQEKNKKSLVATEDVIVVVEPVVAVTEPKVAVMELEVAVAEPVVAVTESVVAVVEPVVAVTEPEVAVTEPVVAVTEPEVAVTEPVVAVTEPVVAVTESVVTEPEVAVTESVVTEPEVAVTEPVVAVMEREVAVTEPDVTYAERVVAATEPVAGPSASQSSVTSHGRRSVFQTFLKSRKNDKVTKKGKKEREPTDAPIPDRYVGDDPFGNYHMLTVEAVKTILQKERPNHNLSTEQIRQMTLKINHMLEDFFNYYCNLTPYPYGFLSFQQLMEAWKGQLLIPDDATTPDVLRLMKSIFLPGDFSRAEGIILPSRFSRSEDTLDFLYQ